MTDPDETIIQHAAQVSVKPVQHVTLSTVSTWWLCIAFLILCSACTFKNNIQHMKARVELDIFSGGQNPTWVLTPEESKELLQLLDSLPEKDNNKNEGGLGYRGFIVTITSDNADTKSHSVHIFNGTVSMDSGAKNYSDKNNVEKWLLRQASGKGYGALADSILNHD